MYNTKNKKVTQHSGIQCVNWDEATEGEKSFLGRKDSWVWKDQGEANMAKKKKWNNWSRKTTFQPTSLTNNNVQTLPLF